MSIKPIIFSAPMVRALLEGRKTQTRRVLTDKWSVDGARSPARHKALDWPTAQARAVSTIMAALMGPDAPPDAHLRVRSLDGETWHRVRPRYDLGDLLWVKESYRAHAEYDGVRLSDIPKGADLQFPADGPLSPWDSKQRPSIFMCEWMSRLTLRVTGVRVQRLQDISEADARAEGAPPFGDHLLTMRGMFNPDHPGNFVETFREIWRDIHGPDAWAANPWVCAVSFDVIQKNVSEVAP